MGTAVRRCFCVRVEQNGVILSGELELTSPNANLQLVPVQVLDVVAEHLVQHIGHHRLENHCVLADAPIDFPPSLWLLFQLMWSW